MDQASYIIEAISQISSEAVVLFVNVGEPEALVLPHPAVASACEQIVLDSSGRLARAFDVKRVPLLVLLNETGRTIWKSEELPRDLTAELARRLREGTK